MAFWQLKLVNGNCISGFLAFSAALIFFIVALNQLIKNHIKICFHASIRLTAIRGYLDALKRFFFFSRRYRVLNKMRETKYTRLKVVLIVGNIRMYVTLYPAVMSATKLLSSVVKRKEDRGTVALHSLRLRAIFFYSAFYFLPKFANVISDRCY